MNRQQLLHVWVAVALSLCCLAPAFVAEAQRATSDEPPSDIAETQRILRGIVYSITQLERDIHTKQEELRSPQGEGRTKALTQEIQELSEKLRALEENLTQVASGIDLQVFMESEATEIDWKKNVVDLLRPLLNELKRMSARPREIEQLRTQIARYTEQQSVLDKGLSNIIRLTVHITDPALRERLKQLRLKWQAWHQEITTQLGIATQQLEHKLAEQPSLAESAKSLMQLFFKSRGRNFILACVGFAAFWFLFHRLQSWFQRWRLFNREGRSFSVRLFTILYSLCTIIGAIFVFLFVLYIFEDWVLLTLALLFLLGIAWTSKQTLPRFVREVMLILNLGAVRENERLMYNGIPWLVQSLNFYTRLVNPALEGGDIRLPLRDFHTLRSRPFGPHEPWFPTRQDDWVLLHQQFPARVILQTPDVVCLTVMGGSQVTFSTQDFLAHNAPVLSTGFLLKVTFGVDYQHQRTVTSEIPAILKTALQEGLAREHYAEHLTSLTVEFSEAGASSLDLAVLAGFSGEAAPLYYALCRAIQRLCVDACNANGWGIPFTQLTLHMAAPDVALAQAPTNGPEPYDP